MGKEVYDSGWGNLSNQGLGATVRSGNVSRDTAVNLPGVGEYIAGALMTQVTPDSIAVSPVTTAADNQSFIAALVDVNSIKVDLEDGVVKNFEAPNAVTQVTLGQVYAAFNVDQVDEANSLLYVDANGVFGLYAADPGAGFTLVTRASLIRQGDYDSIETVGVALDFNSITYTNGITFRLVSKW